MELNNLDNRKDFKIDLKWNYTKTEKEALEFFGLDFIFSENEFKRALEKKDIEKYRQALYLDDTAKNIEKEIKFYQDILEFCLYKQKKFDETLKTYFFHYIIEDYLCKNFQFGKSGNKIEFQNLMCVQKYAVFEIINLLKLIEKSETKEDVDKYVSDFDKDFSKLLKNGIKDLLPLDKYKEEKIHRYDKKIDDSKKDEDKLSADDIIDEYKKLINSYKELGIINNGDELYQKAILAYPVMLSHRDNLDKVKEDYQTAVYKLNEGIATNHKKK